MTSLAKKDISLQFEGVVNIKTQMLILYSRLWKISSSLCVSLNLKEIHKGWQITWRSSLIFKTSSWINSYKIPLGLVFQTVIFFLCSFKITVIYGFHEMANVFANFFFANFCAIFAHETQWVLRNLRKTGNIFCESCAWNEILV